MVKDGVEVAGTVFVLKTVFVLTTGVVVTSVVGGRVRAGAVVEKVGRPSAEISGGGGSVPSLAE